jgi:hypothetical protein
MGGYARAVVTAALVCSVACGFGLESQLRTRAAFDMKCPEEQLRLTDLGGGGWAGGVKGVEGCGQRATYVYQPNGNAWVLNTTDGPGKASAPDVPEKPSPEVSTTALARVLPQARGCLAAGDPVSKASVTFASNGAVSSVVVSGDAAGKPAEGCIKAALERAAVPPFTQAGYAANVTVRPN